MKIIKLLLLLTFGLWSDFKLDVPNDINVSKGILNNKTLEKTFVKFNKEIKNAKSIYSLKSTMLSMYIFLEDMNCSTKEIENTIQDNLFTTISWEKALKNGKEYFIKTVIAAAKQEAIVQKVENIAKDIVAIEGVILREVEAYNLKVVLIMKENNGKSIDEKMSHYTQDKIERVNKLSLELKDAMHKYTSKKQFVKDYRNKNKVIELKGMNAAITYMYTMISFDETIKNMENLIKKQFTLLETCVQ